jgi:hypothetical protein
MDLDSGEIITVLPPGDLSSSLEYVLSISPTGRRLAYIYPSYSPASTTIHLLDLQNGEIRDIVLEENWQGVGWFHWSEDGLQLSFMVEDRMVSRYYYLTYDVISLQFIRSQPYTPWWVED